MITQGRQNIEWLSIGRKQVYALSRGRYLLYGPYSAQATAALVAQFPTQWPTIRDYGFAHPALVPFINEDPMLVMSLIEGLGTRWLVGDGNTHIVSGVKSLPTTTAKCKVLYNSSNSIRMDLFGARSDGENQYAFYVSYNEDWGSGRMRYINGSSTQGNIVLNNGMHEIELRPNQFICDGTTYSTGTNSGTQYDLIVMGVRFNAANNGQGMKGQGMAYLELKNTTGGDRLFVPFVSPSRNGMLDIHDLENPVFYPNAGTGQFTISETPAA